ncbi:hypothetical protein LCGC14_2516030, partial [marine sediment metagenome]
RTGTTVDLIRAVATTVDVVGALTATSLQLSTHLTCSGTGDIGDGASANFRDMFLDGDATIGGDLSVAGAIFNTTAVGSQIIAGGVSGNAGANILLLGPSHASLANDIQFKAGGTVVAAWDNSASLWDFQGNAVSTTGTVNTGALTVTGDAIVSDQVTIGGAIEAGSIFNIEPGVAARDLLTSVGLGFHIEADTWDINAAGNGETVAIGSLAFFGIPTWTSVGTTFTSTDAATVHIQGAPVGSTNVTLTNPRAFYVEAGLSEVQEFKATGLALNRVSKSANYIATVGDYGIDVDASGGARTITLPAATDRAGMILNIKNDVSTANAVTVDGDGTDTIDFALTATVPFPQAITIQSDGVSNWAIR